eukprot:5294116-Pyramimonas_sp.AAC.1
MPRQKPKVNRLKSEERAEVGRQLVLVEANLHIRARCHYPLPSVRLVNLKSSQSLTRRQGGEGRHLEVCVGAPRAPNET